MLLRKTKLFILSSLLCQFSIAQQVNFIKYSVYDGLVANPVRCIYRDSKGFIWIGTIDGLSRYDGYKFTNYTNTNGLSHNLINSIYEVNKKLLIAENDGSVDIIENNTIRKEFKTESPVNIILPYHDRLLLPSDANGFYEYKDDKVILPKQEKTNSALVRFLPFTDSLLLTASADNRFILFRKNLTVHSSSANLNIFSYSLFQDSKKRIWACTTHGLKLMEITTGKNPSISFTMLPSEFRFFPLLNSQVTSMLEESDGSFWIGTFKGLVHFKPDGNYQVYTEKEGLPSAIINTLYKDKENNMWIGTALGLAKWVSKNNVLFYNAEQKNFKNDVISIYNLNDDTLLVTSEHGLQFLDIKKKEFNDLEGLKNVFYTPLVGGDPLLVHYTNMLGKIDIRNNKVIPFGKLDSTAHTVVFANQHPNGNIFLGCFQGLFAEIGSKIKKILTDRITGMAIDQNGTVWVTTWASGLYAISIKNNPESYQVRNMSYVINDKLLRGVYIDSKKNIWVGTRYNGAFCLTRRSDDKFDIKHFNRQSGLMSDWVISFYETRSGDMWVGTYLGLDKLVKESSGFRIFNFSKALNFFAEIKKIVPIGNDNWICVANTGIATFKDEKLEQSPPLKATILLASLGVLENKLTIFSPSEKISLKPNQNSARFEFSALGFFNERQILYSYRLKGSNDTTWSKPENIHEASYASLSPGNYKFEVRTIGWNGEDGTPAAFSFDISTPFWKQWWFIALSICLVLIFFYGLYRYRIMQLVRLQNVRNSIATDLHDDIGSSLTNISILSELSSKNLSQPEKAQPFLQRISEEVQASSQAMDDIIWSVNTHNDSLEETMARMRRYAAEVFDTSEIKCHLHLEENAGNKKLSMEQRRDVYLIYKEALNNIHKHAYANNVWIEVKQNQNHLDIRIKDDGKGFNTELITHRNGLKNLRSRAEKWNGKIRIKSAEGKGSAIDINIPLKE